MSLNAIMILHLATQSNNLPQVVWVNLAHQLEVLHNQALQTNVFQQTLQDKELVEICPSMNIEAFFAMATQAMDLKEKEKEKQPQKEEVDRFNLNTAIMLKK